MSSLVDFTYLILGFVLTGLSIVFFISRKREKEVNKIKYVVLILIIISVIAFISESLSFLSLSSEMLKSSGKAILSTIFLFLLCTSVTLFFYALYNSDDDLIILEKPSFFKSRKGSIKIGRVMEGNQKKTKFFLSLDDLQKHMFVCGSTGTGKTNFLQYLLMNFSKKHNIPFLLVEFKGEYHFLQNELENLLIIRPGENFSLNIFNPEDALPEVHAERIFDILKSGQFLDESSEFSPQMEKVLVEILTIVCKKKELQSWEGFYKICKKYASKKQKEVPMLSQTLISITNRIRRFSLGSLKALFDTEHNLLVRDLFTRNVLIDLSSIIRLGGEKKDALFFLNMILKYLWDVNITQGAYNFNGIKHLTIIEDVQYFAPKDLSKQTKLTSYLEDIALLQRGTGECLISLATHSDISEDILANCGILVCFKTHLEREALCKLLNLNTENEDYLSILEVGQCIVRVNSIKRPFLLNVPLIQRKYLEISEINKNNSKLIKHFENSENESLKNPNKLFTGIHNKFGKKCLYMVNKLKNSIMKRKRKMKKKFDNFKEDFEQSNEEPESIFDKSTDLNEDEREYEKLKNFIEKIVEEQEKKV
jgi:hypothetical protein